MRISGAAATLTAVTAACGAVTYYVHMLQVEEKKEMRKYVDAEIKADKEAKRAAKANKSS